VKKAVLALALFVVGGNAVSAQLAPTSATFTFSGGMGTCQPTVYNGDPTLNGWICLNQGDPIGGYGSYLDVPFQLGFLNNGYLAGCNTITWDPKVFTIGNGSHNGDAFTVHGSTTCPYYTDEYGASVSHFLDGFSVDANYTVLQHRSCNRGRCITYFTNVLLGGNGEATQVPAS
jgi:hypothetical protein